jgi:hypothetical protein
MAQIKPNDVYSWPMSFYSFEVFIFSCYFVVFSLFVFADMEGESFPDVSGTNPKRIHVVYHPDMDHDGSVMDRKQNINREQIWADPGMWGGSDLVTTKNAHGTFCRMAKTSR